VSKHWRPEIPACEQVKALRDRDGGRCWLCDKPIDFKAERGSAGAPSREHLVPKSRSGPDTLENLVLCHTPCNQKLKDLPLVDKIKMREQVREEAWKAAMRKQIGKLLIP
jgi:5-methylcytosine-specific restriction endonuclease McrA